MERKFKLKKIYPSASNLKVGDTISFKQGEKEIFNPQITNAGTIVNFIYELDKCISFPEFWEEIIEVPEYVECIKVDFTLCGGKHNAETVGKIRKTSELPEWVLGWSLESFWKHYIGYYKPSTKEAYDKQNQPYTVLTYQQLSGVLLYDLVGTNTYRQRGCSFTSTTYPADLFTRNKPNPIISIKDNKTGEVYTVDKKDKSGRKVKEINLHGNLMSISYFSEEVKSVGFVLDIITAKETNTYTGMITEKESERIQHFITNDWIKD